MSINAATNRLTEMGYQTPKCKQSRWNRGTVHRLLKNPAYKGLAAFGKTKCVPKKLRLRTFKGLPTQPKASCSVERLPREKWISIPVPAIVEESLFEIVQEQLEENKRLKRERKTGARYLLQGLVVCNLCGYGYCGNTALGARKHNYYTCGGTRVYANRERKCNSQSLHADVLEQVVWDEVKNLLNNPSLLEKEYQRRVKELEKKSNKNESNKLKAERLKIENNVSRLIDSYAEGIINKSEFEPRVKSYKKRLNIIEQQIFNIIHNENEQHELGFLIKSLEEFSEKVKNNLEMVEWKMKRNIFEILIKQVEIEEEKVTVVFRVSPNSTGNKSHYLLEDCRKSRNAGISY